MSKYNLSTSAEDVMLKRTKSIAWFVLSALFGNLVLHIYKNDFNLQTWVIIGLVLCMSVAVRLTQKDKFKLAAQIIISVLTFGILAIIWTSGGLYDLSLLAIPGISIFAAMLGMSKMNSAVIVTCAVNILLIGVLEHMSLMSFEVTSHGVSRALSICFVLMPILIATYLLTKDYQTVLINLKDSLHSIKKHADNANFLANHDVLTQLPNRVLVKERFNHAKNLSERHSNTRIALLYFDIDEFKAINDSLGHQVGDEYLKFVTQSCKNNIRDSDTMARLGGDEFLVVVEQVKEIDEVVVIANTLLNACREPYYTDGSSHAISSSISIGISIFPDDSKQYDELIDKADLAMYHSKKSGRNTLSFFNSTMSQNALKRAHLLEDMKTSLPRNDFFLVYQPIINLKTGVSEGAEALIRWQHPDKGIVNPAEFITIAEQSGFIVELGDWILEQAIIDCLRFQHELNQPFLVSVNVSAIQLRRGNFTTIFERILNKYQLPDSSICIELTESELFSDNTAFKDFLDFSLKHKIKIAIDDFGTGYSNLGYLHRLKLARLKLDHSFISQLDQSKQKRAVVSSIKHLAKGLQMETVAEGVETEEELKQVMEIGLDRAQGFYWAKPLIFNDAVNFIVTNKEAQAIKQTS